MTVYLPELCFMLPQIRIPVRSQVHRDGKGPGTLWTPCAHFMYSHFMYSHFMCAHFMCTHSMCTHSMCAYFMSTRFICTHSMYPPFVSTHFAYTHFMSHRFMCTQIAPSVVLERRRIVCSVDSEDANRERLDRGGETFEGPCRVSCSGMTLSKKRGSRS
jgi:hypothetical protein